jgi:hypothetical protein
MQPKLSFEQAPPISVPFRFFLTAPVFGVAAGLLLAVTGEAAFESRWTPAAFALAHLLAVGYLLQAMCGALLQFVPVATGGNVWRPQWVAALVHPVILIAAMMLVLGFVPGWPEVFPVAVALFVLGLGLFIGVVAAALWRVSAQGMSLHALRLSLLGLAVTLACGASLALTLSGWIDAPLPRLLAVHVAWGWGGWGLMLILGVSYLVVPMFQLTAPYPPWLARLLPLGLLTALVLWSLQLGVEEPQSWQPWVAGAGIALAALYAAATLHLQARRRRRVADITLVFWRGAMLSLLALAFVWLALVLQPDWAGHPRAALGVGVLVFVGVFVSAINGMLYKIVPFLNWLHLQQITGLKTVPPNIRQMIPERAMRGQLRLHFAALILLLLAVLWPPLAASAGVAFAASCLWLEWNLVGAVRLYRRHLRN